MIIIKITHQWSAKRIAMHYFSKVKLGQEIYSLVFGKGVVVFVLDKKMIIEGFYAFEVEYDNKQRVHYTLDGIPNWCALSGNCQTAFYLKDVDLTDMDFDPAMKILSPEKIKKFRKEGRLELRCPSGLWRNTLDCPERLVVSALKKEQYHLFRKRKNERKTDKE